MSGESLFADPESRRVSEHLNRSLTVIGVRWNGLILATLTPGPLGFSALRRSIDGLGDAVLSTRLVRLADAGLVRREVEVGPPTTITYSLTPAGQAIVPALEALASWSRSYLK
ncbi:winged helix-turn-helix transcriptional regulator [Conyzicola nivalis]|uniref:winged helix-turn-helix transcriptional regulator n=1 Tax=Conyzicola nivalis TaxID=1477021 RepID=UPI001E401E9E|nr:helix-turn-helix domain-containing protein [Conyzicola nivalis]